jgi:mono/diheme cytochrome c family protein
VLAVLLFVLFWVVVAFSLFFVAARGGLGGARASLQTRSRGGRKAVGVILAIVYLGFGVALPVGLLTGNHANANSSVGPVKLTAGEKSGRELFGTHCAVCHTLAAANAIGKVGPNLDTLKPPTELVLHTLTYGCLQSPPSTSSPLTCLGEGNMPAGIVEGTDAQDVAAFVAAVAGKE